MRENNPSWTKGPVVISAFRVQRMGMPRGRVFAVRTDDDLRRGLSQRFSLLRKNAVT